jgi:4-coumarate--CoA ligase
VLRPHTEATEDEVKQFVADQVATYKRLGSVTFVDAVPKSASGKILRRVLRDQANAGG